MSGGAGGAKKISKKNPTIQSSSRLLLFSIYNSPFSQSKVSNKFIQCKSIRVEGKTEARMT